MLGILLAVISLPPLFSAGLLRTKQIMAMKSVLNRTSRPPGQDLTRNFPSILGHASGTLNFNPKKKDRDDVFIICHL